jgi:hypothetical protein
MQHEGIGISAEFGDNERNPLHHQAGNEGDVAGQAIVLGHNDRAFCLARCTQGCGKLRLSIKSIQAFSSLDLREFLHKGDALGIGKRATAALWASMPRPDRPWRCVETLK